MENYQINKNRPKLEGEDLYKQMDFENFLQARPLRKGWRGWKLYLSVFVLLCAFTGAHFLLYKPRSAKESGQLRVTLAQPYSPPLPDKAIEPPIPGLEVPYTEYVVDADRDTMLTFPSGSRIFIQRHSFLGVLGFPVTGPVSIKYREMHDLADVFLSGIYTVYDSTIGHFQLSPAGMIDFRPYQNGTMLRVNDHARVFVDMVSQIPDAGYNSYYLDTIGRFWEYFHGDVPCMQSPDTAIITEEIESPVVLTNVASPPRKADPARPRFNIEFNQSDFPELAGYEGTSFEIAEDEKNYDPALARINWESVSLKSNKNRTGEYLVTFSRTRPAESHTFKVRPVWTGKNYEKARKTYEQLHPERPPQLVMVRRKNLLREYWSHYNPDSSKAVPVPTLVFRELDLARFGIWSFSYPKELPKGLITDIQLTDERGRNLSFSHFFLIERGKPVLNNYYDNQFGNFTFNPSSDNLILAITTDHKLRAFEPVGTKALSPEEDKVEFRNRDGERQIHSANEIRLLLGSSREKK